MDDAPNREGGWKRRILRELFAYWMTVLYLAVYFGAFTTYRRLILAHYQISYTNYGVALIEAAVLAKVIMLGDLLRLGPRFENRPLIIPTFFRSVTFTLWVALFTVGEETVRGLIRREGWMTGVDDIAGRPYEFIASCVVVFFTFIPFFALKELNRALGKGKIWRLFFCRTVVSPGKADVQQQHER